MARQARNLAVPLPEHGARAGVGTGLQIPKGLRSELVLATPQRANFGGRRLFLHLWVASPLGTEKDVGLEERQMVTAGAFVVHGDGDTVTVTTRAFAVVLALSCVARPQGPKSWC